MTCNAIAGLRARTPIATIALIAGGCLVMSGVTAEPAAAQNSSEITKQGWMIEVSPTTEASPAPSVSLTPPAGAAAQASPATSPPYSAGDFVRPSYLGAYDKEKAGDRAADTGRQRGKVAGGDDLFRSGPEYDEKYDPQGNVDIYGKKVAIEPPRPPIELGRQQYTSGAYEPSSTLFGELNPLLPGLAVYGDWRTAVAYNSNKGNDIAQIATRLNIDIDFKLTGTERIHAFFTPLQNGAKFTRYEFGGGDGDGKFTDEFDANPQTLFFEGDLGAITSGLSGTDSGFDLPFTVGLFPLFLQNGIWANDAILGGAVTIPAKNSAKLGLPNYDVTFFAAFDNVDNAGILGKDALGNNENSNANIFGVTTFIDAFGGYIEAGYAAIQGKEDVGLVEDGQLTHFLTAAYSRRYANTISNTTRVFANFGDGQNDEGLAIISENSLITGGPATFVPYFNFFVGFDNPQPLVDGNGAGILKNVGINFETDALTGFPKLNDTGADTYGGAIGLTYLFGSDLGQQLIFEVATVQPFDDNVLIPAQYGFGVRYQIALTRAWLLRADATYQIIENDEDNFGMRMELRRKF